MVDASEGRFWEILKDRERFEAFVEEKSGQLREWEKERDELLEQVGAGMKFPSNAIDVVDEFTRITKRRQALDFLSAETQEQVLALDARYDRLREKAAASNIDLKPEELRAEHARLEREQMSEMKGMLTAEELSEYNLRNSRAAEIRFRLGDFTASNEEIREIVRIREAERKGVQSRDGVSSEEGAWQISSLLGPDRFEAFKRAQDFEFQQLSRLGERLNLSPEVVASAYEVRILAEKRIAEVEAQRALGEAARNSALARIRAETENSLNDTLGPEAFAAVRKGWQDWLRNPGR
jgi:predicted metal-binding transcription factor (methanogenesis marker protein 9)